MAGYSKFTTTVMVLIFGFIACKKDEAIKQEPDKPANKPLADTTLTIGTFFGLCFPKDSCVAIYKLSDGKVFRDTTHNYPRDTSNYQFVPLQQRQYQKVEQLKSAFPRRMMSDTTTELGCPDCRDQGGFYVALKADGYQQTWLIDKDLDAVSPYLHPFLEKVDKAVQQLP